MVKSGAGLAPLPFDLALYKTLAAGQSALVEVGDNVTFTIQVVNVGTVTVANIEVADNIPMGLTLNDSRWDAVSSGKAVYVILGPLASGQSASIDIIMTVGTVVAVQAASTSCAGCGNLVNTASIVSAEDELGNVQNDADPTNDEGQAAIQVGAPSLLVKATSLSPTAQPGVELAYSLLYSNTNAYVAKNVILQEIVPQNTTFVAASSTPGWSCANVTAGSVCTYHVGTVQPNTVAGVPIIFTCW